jgi:hypothetical protein
MQADPAPCKSWERLWGVLWSVFWSRSSLTRRYAPPSPLRGRGYEILAVLPSLVRGRGVGGEGTSLGLVEGQVNDLNVSLDVTVEILEHGAEVLKLTGDVCWRFG